MSKILRIMESVSIFQWKSSGGIDFFGYSCVCDAWLTTVRYRLFEFGFGQIGNKHYLFNIIHFSSVEYNI